MNTIRSTWIGWGTLCVAGGGAYYFAKRQINSEKQARFEKEMQKKSRVARLEASGYGRDESTSKTSKPSTTDVSAAKNHSLDPAGSPSKEAGDDVAPVTHASVGRERSKYEAEPFRSRKGDRFS